MISVIIPTYKAPQALDICLQSAIDNQKHNNQIIVVVDGFYDINREVLEKYNEKINILDLETNHGLIRATNLGVFNAQFERILVINDDNVFQRNWDEQLLKTYHPNRVISPNQIEPLPSMYPQFVINNLGGTEDFELEGFYNLADEVCKEEMTKWGSTMPFFMNKEKYLMVDGWDESYPGPWVVDWEFFHKLHLAGCELLRTFNCHFYHFGGLSYGRSRRDGQGATIEEEMKKREKLNACDDYFKYKWGFYPVKTEEYKLCEHPHKR